MGKAMRGALSSIGMFLLVPTLALLLCLGTASVAQAIDSATRDGAAATYSTEVIFSTVDKTMLTEEGKRWFEGRDIYAIYSAPNTQVKEMAAVKIVYGGGEHGVTYYSDAACSVEFKWAHAGESGFDRLTRLVHQDAYFDTFILPMLGGFVMLTSLAMAGITIAQRLFSITFLLIISPVPICARPLDDGARYKKWAEIFLSKVVSGYGIIFALNVFFTLSPMLIAIDYFSSALANGVARLIIYIAGVAFATGANVLVGQLIGADAGTSERDQAAQNFRSTMSGAHGAMMAVRGAKNAVFGNGKSRGGMEDLTALADALGVKSPNSPNKISRVLGSGSDQKSLGSRMASRMSKMPIARLGKGIGQLGMGVGHLAGGLRGSITKKPSFGVAARNLEHQKAKMRDLLLPYKNLPSNQRKAVYADPKLQKKIAERREKLVSAGKAYQHAFERKYGVAPHAPATPPPAPPAEAPAQGES